MSCYDRERLDSGGGIRAKNPEGHWTPEEHVLLGSTPAASAHDPWISTSTEIQVTEGFDHGCGVVMIDLSKVKTEVVTYEKIGNVWANELNFKEKIIYHRSVWQQEVLIKKYVPREAITPLYKNKR